MQHFLISVYCLCLGDMQADGMSQESLDTLLEFCSFKESTDNAYKFQNVIKFESEGQLWELAQEKPCLLKLYIEGCEFTTTFDNDFAFAALKGSDHVHFVGTAC